MQLYTVLYAFHFREKGGNWVQVTYCLANVRNKRRETRVMAGVIPFIKLKLSIFIYSSLFGVERFAAF